MILHFELKLPGRSSYFFASPKKYQKRRPDPSTSSGLGSLIKLLYYCGELHLFPDHRLNAYILITFISKFNSPINTK